MYWLPWLAMQPHFLQVPRFSCPTKAAGTRLVQGRPASDQARSPSGFILHLAPYAIVTHCVHMLEVGAFVEYILNGLAHIGMTLKLTRRVFQE